MVGDKVTKIKQKPKKKKIPNSLMRKKINELLRMLSPFKKITDNFQGNGVTSSIVINSILELQKKLMTMNCVYFNSFRQNLLKYLQHNKKGEERFVKILKDPKFVIATVLDPRFKDALFSVEVLYNI